MDDYALNGMIFFFDQTHFAIHRGWDTSMWSLNVENSNNKRENGREKDERGKDSGTGKKDREEVDTIR